MDVQDVALSNQEAVEAAVVDQPLSKCQEVGSGSEDTYSCYGDHLVRLHLKDGSFASMTLPYLLKYVQNHRLKIRYLEFKPNKWIDVTGVDYELLMNAQYILDNIVRSDTGQTGERPKRILEPEDFNQTKLDI